MLRYNPIRAQHEFVWYLESRFPGRHVETLNVGRHARVLPLTPVLWSRERLLPEAIHEATDENWYH